MDIIKLHLGCGTQYKEGWVNIDNNLDNNIQRLDINHDITQGIPFESDSVNYIYHEHLFEHLTFEEGLALLKECYRVLKPNGVMRVLTPDLDDIIDGYLYDSWRNQEWVTKYYFDWVESGCYMVNMSLSQLPWGHKFVYNRNELNKSFLKAGFKKENIFATKFRVSGFSELNDLDTRADSMFFDVQKHKPEIIESSKLINPKVTVVIPSYNHGKFIRQAVQSILKQTYQDFEILIVDDCSFDNTLDELEKLDDPRIKIIINEKNMGACYGHNLMLDKARGEYIALLNSDDCWLPKKLEKQVEFLESHPNYAAVFSYAKYIGEDGALLEDKNHVYYNVFNQHNRSRHEWLNYFFNKGNCLCHPSILMRSKVYSEIGYYDRLMTSLPDFDMWVRVCLKYEIYILPEVLVEFRILNNESNASTGSAANVISCQFEYKQILDHFVKLSNKDYKLIFGVDVIHDVQLDLAFRAVNMPEGFRQDWGLSIIRKRVQRDGSILSDREFTSLTRKHDIYNVIGLRDLNTQISNLLGEIHLLKVDQDNMLNSRSWKLASLLRFIANKLRLLGDK